MATAYPLPTNFSPATVNNTASLLRIVALALISGAAIASRLFAVINFESIIHELCVNSFIYVVNSGVDMLLLTVIHGSISERTFVPCNRTTLNDGIQVGQRGCLRPRAFMYVPKHFLFLPIY